MGCRILDGREDGAVLYCSTTEWAFGPLFRSSEHAEDFLAWLKGEDPRSFSNVELSAKFGDWMVERCDTHGKLIEKEETDE